MWQAIAGEAAGRLIGNLFDIGGSGEWLRDKKRIEEIDDRLELERRGIVARVEGAKAAGLHPLVAMGFQSSVGPVQSVQSEGSIHPNPGFIPPPEEKPAPAPSVDPSIQRYNEARARSAEIEADQRFLDYQRSLFNLGSQPGNPQGGGVILPTDKANLGNGAYKKGVVVKPDEVTAGVGGLTSGTHPGASVVALPYGYGKMTVPQGKLKEALEDQEFMSTLALMAMNRQRISSFLLKDIPDAIFGVRPMMTQKQYEEQKRRPSVFGKRPYSTR